MITTDRHEARSANHGPDDANRIAIGREPRRTPAKRAIIGRTPTRSGGRQRCGKLPGQRDARERGEVRVMTRVWNAGACDDVVSVGPPHSGGSYNLARAEFR